MEDDKKNAVTEEVAENVQHEAGLPNKEVKIDPSDTPSVSEDQFVEVPEENTETQDNEQPEGDTSDVLVDDLVAQATHETLTENLNTENNGEESVVEEVASSESDSEEPVSEEIKEVISEPQNEIEEVPPIETQVSNEEQNDAIQNEVVPAETKEEIKAEPEVETTVAEAVEKESTEVEEAVASESDNEEPVSEEIKEVISEPQNEIEEVSPMETQVSDQEQTDAVQNEVELTETKGEKRAEPEIEKTVGEAVEKESVVEGAKTENEEVVSAKDSNTEGQLNENEISAIDLDTLSKVEQLDLLKKILDDADIRKIDNLFKSLGAHYDAVFDSDKKGALDTFLKIEESDKADFKFKGDDTDQEFHNLYEKLRRKRAQFYQELGKEKDNNLKKKNEILVLLREILDGENQENFDKVKSLQQEWKNIGPVPGAQNHTLWQSYHALMDRFYDHRSIYFELKELDRRKNLDAKFELCKKAEMLDASTDIKSAITHLNELHEEFKHIGPVPREDQEALWQRFKAASDQVYEKRNEFHEQQKAEFGANLEKKLVLVEEAKALAVFDTDRIKIWNTKTKELLELQKKWEAVGGIPRQSAKDINKSFWGSFKKFFANKSRFFKKLDGERDENLAKKRVLIQKALEIKDAENWEATANAMKALQTEWKDIGIVPDKFRKSLYEEFNGHCNHFFERKRGQSAEENIEFEKNLEKKKIILTKLQVMTDEVAFDLDKAFTLLDEFSSAGLVPRNYVGKTLEKYDKVCGQLLKVNTLSEIELDELKLHIQVSKMRNSPNGDRKVNRKGGLLKRKISGMENDIYNWKRNIDFFGRSKNAEQMKNDFLNRISDAEKELESMKKELRLLNN